MTHPIVLDNVSKCYRIYASPQDRIKQGLFDRMLPLLKGDAAGRNFYREHWALQNVSLQLAEGESVGILGRNGAGKSTLLQIIAGTLTPSSGAVDVQGRITALLELGSGFNPDFTGRENVFLNGAVLGLTHSEVEQRFDEIAAFADIGDFLEQPVKTYSSGMLMRLAFSVQTAVEPKILIIDEALSVGDMFFQVKCMLRLKQLVDNGVSLLFVSHSVDTVRQICQRAVLLEQGRVIAQGPAGSVSDRYVASLIEDRNSRTVRVVVQEVPEAEDPVESLEEAPDTEAPVYVDMNFSESAALNRSGNGKARVLNVEILRGGVPVREFEYDDEVVVRVTARFDHPHEMLNHAIWISTPQGLKVLYQDTRLQDALMFRYDAGTVHAFDWHLRLPLMHGSYSLGCALSCPPREGGRIDWEFFDVIPVARQFLMYQRRTGMIGGLVVPQARLVRTEIQDAAISLCGETCV